MEIADAVSWLYARDVDVHLKFTLNFKNRRVKLSLMSPNWTLSNFLSMFNHV